MSDTLKTLLPEEELKDLASKISTNDTPLWKHWVAFVECRERFGRSTSTLKSVRSTLKKVIREKEIYSLNDLNNKRRVQEALLELKDIRGFDGSTYNTYLKNIKTYLIWLEKEGFISNVNLRNVQRFPEKIVPQIAQTPSEVRQIIGQISSRERTTLLRLRDIVFYQILVLTGARPSELEVLTLNSIKKNGAEWTLEIVGTKNKPSRRVFHLPSSVKDAITSYMLYRQKYGRNEKYLLISRRRDTAWTTKGMGQLMKDLTNELGFSVGMLKTRRFVATSLAEAGMPLERISDHLGHRRISTTKRYIEQSGVLTSKNVEILEDLIFQS